MNFKELAAVQKDILSKQKPTNLLEARKQVKLLKKMSSDKNKKQRK